MGIGMPCVRRRLHVHTERRPCVHVDYLLADSCESFHLSSLYTAATGGQSTAFWNFQDPDDDRARHVLSTQCSQCSSSLSVRSCPWMSMCSVRISLRSYGSQTLRHRTTIGVRAWRNPEEISTRGIFICISSSDIAT